MMTIYNYLRIDKVAFFVLVVWGLVSCTADQLSVDESSTQEIVDGREFIAKLGAYANDLSVVQVRSGGVEDISQIEHLRILVFDEDQKFLYTSDAIIGREPVPSPSDDASYLPTPQKENITQMRSFQVKLVESSKPRYLHFIVDYDWKNFSQDYFLKGTSAGELIPQLETTLEAANGNNPTRAFSPMWAMVKAEKLNKDFLQGKVIKLLRNYSKIGIEIAPEVEATDGFTLEAFCVANSLNKGTVAPFKVVNYRYEFPYPISRPTVPVDAELLSTPTDDFMIAPDKTFNLFETHNENQQKTCVIIKGTKAGETGKRYYKIDLVNRANENSINEYIQIIRNNWYVVKISGVKSKGYSSLEDALKAPADNNLFASVEMKDYSKVSDGVYNLQTDPIQIVIVQPGTYSFNTLFNGESEYTRFYPNWDKEKDLYLGDWQTATNLADPNQTVFSFTAKQIPSDNILEYKVEVVGLRYADKNGVNPGEPGYDPDNNVPVIDGYSGATTPITRTVQITLRNPYQFKAKLDDDPNSSEVADNILSFEVYNSIPKTLIPFEVLIEASDITPRNMGASTDLMIVERDKKLYYSYTVNPETYKTAIESGKNRIQIPVKINDGTATLKGNITLTSKLYAKDVIYGESESKPREVQFNIWYYLPDRTLKWMPSNAENAIQFKLNSVSYTGDKIKLLSVGNEGQFLLQVFDDALANQKLEISAWVTRPNPYGFFSYLVKKEMTVNEWLVQAGRDVQFEGASIHVKGFLVHKNGYYETLRPNLTPRLYAVDGSTPPRSVADITSVANYTVGSGSYKEGLWGYEVDFTIPESEYVSNKYNWTGVGIGYYDDNRWYHVFWSDWQSTTLCYWYY